LLNVGLTGNIASGKSTVARVWEALGATVVDADKLARRAVERGTLGLARIEAEWGTGVLTPQGELDRAKLREIVFRDPAAKARLEAIVHPEVARLRDAAYREAEARGERLVVADVPLLFEVGLEDEFDVVVLVEAPEELRIERLVRDRGLETEAAQRMIAAQMPNEQKRGRAHVVITNTGAVADVEAQAGEVWKRLEEQAGVRASGGGVAG
jgi:dephospho-CoA kinase